MNKLRVGDLVTLSAAGRKNKGNSSWVKGFGIVVELHRWTQWPISCRWSAGNSYGHFKPYELKRLKPDKKCPRQNR